jgi:hypothetical protein
MSPSEGVPAGPVLLVDALRLLPGVRPVAERNRLGEARHRASRAKAGIASFNGIDLTLAQLGELFIYDAHGRPCVSPAGAALLLELHGKGAFVHAPARQHMGNQQLLVDYAKGLAVVIPSGQRRGGPRRDKPRPAPDKAPAAQPVETERPLPDLYPQPPAVTIHRLD